MAKTLNGKVVSTAMLNTVVVEVSRRIPHPLYKKLLNRSKKFKVETEGKTVTVGDIVNIVEMRQASKGKYFKLTEITKDIKEAKHE